MPPVYRVMPDPYRPVPPLSQRLMRHFKSRARGRSVLLLDGEYQTVDTPSQAQIDLATEVYLGGHVYEVTGAQAAALEAAGYEVG